MTKQQFLEGTPFQLSGRNYRYMSAALPGCPEGGVLLELSICGEWYYQGDIDAIEKWGVEVFNFWLGKKIQKSLLYRNLEPVDVSKLVKQPAKDLATGF